MGKTNKHTPEFGSKIAKGGFNNEQDVVNQFNNWKEDRQAQFCLNEMGYDLTEISKVEAYMIRDIIKNSNVKDKGNPKSDIQVQVTIFLKNIPDPQNISVKLVSSQSGFNQIDKRRIDKYREMWKIPDDIVLSLKYFTGEVEPIDFGFGLSDDRRMYLNQLNLESQRNLINFFEDNKITIISDIIKGRGAFSAQWMLVVHKVTDTESKWAFKSINEVINHYSKGEVKISPKGSLNIGKLTAQRKGGDGGRESAKMLQFKFNPLELI